LMMASIFFIRVPSERPDAPLIPQDRASR
jgi:hypothetical protein